MLVLDGILAVEMPHLHDVDMRVAVVVQAVGGEDAIHAGD
jgi:hypothetical protein